MGRVRRCTLFLPALTLADCLTNHQSGSEDKLPGFFMSCGGIQILTNTIMSS